MIPTVILTGTFLNRQLLGNIHIILTIYVDMHEAVKNRLHEFIMQCCQFVVIQLNPLYAMKILKGRRRYIFYPVKQGKQIENMLPSIFKIMSFLQ